LRLEIARKDSYLVTTGAESILCVRHRILQVIEPLLQGLDPCGIDPTIGLVEGNGHFEIFDLRCHDLVLLRELDDSIEELGPIRVDDRLGHLEAVAEQLKHLHASIQRTQVLIDTTEDLSGVLHTLAPFLL